jgi:hypothetical protein
MSGAGRERGVRGELRGVTSATCFLVKRGAICEGGLSRPVRSETRDSWAIQSLPWQSWTFRGNDIRAGLSVVPRSRTATYYRRWLRGR